MADKNKKAAAGKAAPAPAQAKAANANAPKSDAKKTDQKKVIQKPNEQKLDEDLKAIEVKINELISQQKKLQERILNADGKTPVGGKRKELMDERAKAFNEFRTIREEKEKLQRQNEDIQRSYTLKIKEAEEIRGRAGPDMTLEKIDQTIAAHESKIKMGNLKILDEKKLVTEIENLKRSRKSVEIYQKRIKEIDEDKKSTQPLRDSLAKKDEEYKAAHDKLKGIEAQLDKLKKEQEDDKAKVNQLIEERNKAKAKIDQLKVSRQKLYDNFRKEREAYRAFQIEELRKKKEAQRLLREKLAEERKKAEEERRKEERLIPKFVDEISTATNLIQYLQSFSQDKTEGANQTEKKENNEQINGMILLKSKAQREQEDQYYAAKTGGKKEKKPAAKPHKKVDTITFPLAMFEQFDKLRVALPSTTADLEKTILALQERKAFFEKRQAEELAKGEQEEKEDAMKSHMAALEAQEEAIKAEEAALQQQEAAFEKESEQDAQTEKALESSARDESIDEQTPSSDAPKDEKEEGEITE